MNKPPPAIDKRMPEPMEVDHFRSQQRCYSCGKFCHLARHCRGPERVGYLLIGVTVSLIHLGL
jgi:hypothetical protein